MNYREFSLEDKMGLLQLLYYDLKNKSFKTTKDIEDMKLIVDETAVVYEQIKLRRLQ